MTLPNSINVARIAHHLLAEFDRTYLQQILFLFVLEQHSISSLLNQYENITTALKAELFAKMKKVTDQERQEDLACKGCKADEVAQPDDDVVKETHNKETMTHSFDKKKDDSHHKKVDDDPPISASHSTGTSTVEVPLVIKKLHQVIVPPSLKNASLPASDKLKTDAGSGIIKAVESIFKRVQKAEKSDKKNLHDSDSSSASGNEQEKNSELKTHISEEKFLSKFLNHLDDPVYYQSMVKYWEKHKDNMNLLDDDNEDGTSKVVDEPKDPDIVSKDSSSSTLTDTAFDDQVLQRLMEKYLKEKWKAQSKKTSVHNDSSLIDDSGGASDNNVVPFVSENSESEKSTNPSNSESEKNSNPSNTESEKSTNPSQQTNEKSGSPLQQTDEKGNNSTDLHEQLNGMLIDENEDKVTTNQHSSNLLSSTGAGSSKNMHAKVKNDSDSSYDSNTNEDEIFDSPSKTKSENNNKKFIEENNGETKQSSKGKKNTKEKSDDRPKKLVPDASIIEQMPKNRGFVKFKKQNESLIEELNKDNEEKGGDDEGNGNRIFIPHENYSLILHA